LFNVTLTFFSRNLTASNACAAYFCHAYVSKQRRKNKKTMMKNMTFFLLSVLCVNITDLLYAQNNDDLHIKIDATINGQQINIDTMIDEIGDFNLEEYLEKLGIQDDMSELNIDISDGTRFNFEFDTEAFDNIIQNLESIELPELPEMPDFPALAPLEDMYFSNGNKAFLGVMTKTAENNDGVIITEVIENTAAEAAGLNEGDMIMKINDKTIESTNNLIEVLSVYNPGDKVEVTYMRDGKQQTTEATLKENENYVDWEKQNADWEDYGKEWEQWSKEYENNWKEWKMDSSKFHFEEKGFLGVVIHDMDEEAGAKIIEIVEKSPAEQIGLRAGDIINTIEGITIKNFNDVLQAIQSKKPGDEININYTRDNATFDVRAILKANKTYYWNTSDDEGSIFHFNAPAPAIKIYSCPDKVNAYCYSLNNGSGKNINMSIKINSSADNPPKAPAPGNIGNATATLLDPETIQFYPNPSTGTFTLKFELESNGDTDITIRDIDGKVMYKEYIQGFEGSYEKLINLKNAPKGTYFINVKQNNYTATKQIVLQ
jgi:hypothetical protein